MKTATAHSLVISGSLYVLTITRAPAAAASSTSSSGVAAERRRDRGRIAQRLRRDPVLAVAAVQVAAEHAEAVRERARQRVEERLLLDRVALHAADVAPGHAQPAAVVEAHLADADRAVRQRAAMAARVAAQASVGQHVVELALASFARQDFSQVCHVRSLYWPCTAAFE